MGSREAGDPWGTVQKGHEFLVLPSLPFHLVCSSKKEGAFNIVEAVPAAS